jgi:hypothetical protein
MRDFDAELGPGPHLRPEGLEGKEREEAETSARATLERCRQIAQEAELSAQGQVQRMMRGVEEDARASFRRRAMLLHSKQRSARSCGWHRPRSGVSKRTPRARRVVPRARYVHPADNLTNLTRH